jgi:hypothetical protein
MKGREGRAVQTGANVLQCATRQLRELRNPLLLSKEEERERENENRIIEKPFSVGVGFSSYNLML